MKIVVLERLPFPFRERLDDLCFGSGILYIKGNLALYTVQVIVQTCGSFQKQRGGDPVQVECLAEGVSEKMLDVANRSLGIVKSQNRLVAFGNINLAHNYSSCLSEKLAQPLSCAKEYFAAASPPKGYFAAALLH
jgi:hypothetical protein